MVDSNRSTFLRKVLSSGGSLFHQGVAYLLAVWVTHGVLRAFVLYRDDAFGFPFVGKPDWYIFHALLIDSLWIQGYSLIFLLALVGLGAIGYRKTGMALLWLLVIFHSSLLLFTVCDHETMRFMGMHLDFSIIDTYGNSASMPDVLQFLESDESIRYLPYGLFAGCVPLSLILFSWLRRREWARVPALTLRVPAVMVVIALLAHVFLFYIWPGGFRMMKLRPVTESIVRGLQNKRGLAPDPIPLAKLGHVFQSQWILEQGDSSFVFPDTAYPFYKEPVEMRCARLAKTKLGLADSGIPDTKNLAELESRCLVDKDQDGFLPDVDCEDLNPRSYPGATDVPGNGVDEDCNGVDAKPVNFVIILMESHRAVNVGHLKPFGALPGGAPSPTPVLDSLANGHAHSWTRFSCSGIPTINALLSMHMSILQHPTRYISSDFTDLKNRSFAETLTRKGYQTRYFSAADPSWDGKVPWLRQWYQDITYERTRETDDAMFQHLAAWMKDSVHANQPVLVTALTKTNHYPFNHDQGVKRLPHGAGIQEKMRATMEYSEGALGRFLQSVRGEKWFANTLFIILADHGFPLSEHGSSSIGFGLYNETLWIPFVIAGAHPKLGPAALHDYPASQLDLGPTLLDLAGIRTPNHFLGHSLVRPATGINSTSYLVRSEQGSLEQGDYRIHGPIGETPREQGIEVFHSASDRLEKQNLYPEPGKPIYDSLITFLQTMATLNTYAVEADIIWPEAAEGPETTGKPGPEVKRP